ncbi:MAG TPA: MarR family transcriptional regulator [Lachnospiraceae bacterium]|nr:MarR family transcriptional regulator [Lachnospiraceae bacterium]
MKDNFKLMEYDDEHILFGILFVLGNRLQVIGDTFYEEITTKQWLVLIILEVMEEQPPTLNELADAMGSSHQNVKQLVLKLESKGYVEMLSDEHDRRKTRIKMSESCHKVFEKYKPMEMEFMERLYEGVDKEDLKGAVRTLLQLEENMINMRNRK